MPRTPAPRLMAIVGALPLRPGMRVLEIGCGPGAAAREIARRIGGGHVLAIDRSARAIALARAASRPEIASGRLSVRQVAVEEFELQPGEVPYHLAVAIRVGVLDGRHPETEREAHRRIAAALTPSGRLFIDGGNPLREIRLQRSDVGSHPLRGRSKRKTKRRDGPARRRVGRSLSVPRRTGTGGAGSAASLRTRARETQRVHPLASDALRRQ